MKSTKTSFAESVWSFFCSLKLTIFLLIGLAAASIIGTIIPQNAPHDQYLQMYEESTIRLFSALNFFDMYHSLWFMLLLYFLSMNLLACSIRRFPRDWKLVAKPDKVLDDQLEKSLTQVRHLPLPGNAPELREKLEAFLRREFALPVVTEEKGNYYLFAQKGLFNRFGVYVVHLSVIVIFIGGIIGSTFGYRAYMGINEGKEASVAFIRASSGGTQSPEAQTIDLGFSVRCDKFSIAYYDNGMPKEYRSVLTIMEGGKPVIEKKAIVVNSPLTYKGITFYQSSYDRVPTLYLAMRDRKSGAVSRITAQQGEPVSLSDGTVLQVLEHTEDIREVFPQLSGPAVRLALKSPGGHAQPLLLLKDYPEIDQQRGGEQVFTYEGTDYTWRTGLQVVKDPGVGVVWLGCALMLAGLFIAFFMSHRRIWVRVENGHITMAGAAKKNQAAFDQFFESLAEKLKAV